jgi:cell division septation protein DedD
MKRLLENTLFCLLSLVMLSSYSSDKHTTCDPVTNVSLTLTADTTGLLNLLDVKSFRLSIIPPSSGVQFYKDGIVFLSLSKLEKKMSSKQISFGAVEAYYATVEDSLLSTHTIFSPLSAFSYPSEAMTFSKDFNTLYFTMIPKKDKNSKIFSAKFATNNKNQKGLFIDKTPLNFCNDNAIYSNPTLSSDDKLMIFASDRNGSLGGMDLFLTRLEGNIWSVPESLGNQINTTGNEFFPFLDSDNNLYFASDKLPGFGGYDLFTCKFNGAGWDKPVNLSDRINTDKDDIAFTISNTDGKTAFFSRRQRSGKTGIELFRVTLKPESTNLKLATLSYIFNGIPVAGTGTIVANHVAEVKLPDTEPAKITDNAVLFKKDTVKAAASKPVISKVSEKPAVIKTETEIKPEKTKPVETKTASTVPAAQNNEVIYRVQILSAANPKKTKEVIMNGKSYPCFEYLYKGAYRITIGEFKSLQPAMEFQKTCRQSGYQDAFVAAFIDNARSLDPKLFK